MDNQINLGKIYGIESTQGTENDYGLSNFVKHTNIPSLEQIASYNLATRGIYPNQQNTDYTPDIADADYPTGVPYDVNFNDMNNTQFTPTPATTIASGVNATQNPTTPINMSSSTAITDFSNPFPVTAESIQYLNGFIRTQIGRRMTVTFLVGSNQLEDKSGYLLGVGANYILINELDTNDLTACDFYNIKFIRFYY